MVITRLTFKTEWLLHNELTEKYIIFQLKIQIEINYKIDRRILESFTHF